MALDHQLHSLLQVISDLRSGWPLQTELENDRHSVWFDSVDVCNIALAVEITFGHKHQPAD